MSSSRPCAVGGSTVLQDSRLCKSRHVSAPCKAASHADGAAPPPLQGGLEQVYRAALALGTVNQLTNILRDVGEDVHERNRIYVPLDELDQFGIRESEVCIFLSAQPGISSAARRFFWAPLSSIERRVCGPSTALHLKHLA